MSKTKKPKLFIKRALLDIKSPDYQPTQEELNEEFDIPGVEQMCSVQAVCIA